MRLLKWAGIAIGATLFFFTVLTFGWVLSSEELVPPRQTDYIVVISGPGPETAERTAMGIELFETVQVTGRLVMSGGTGAAEDMLAQAVAAGIPSPNILAENQSRSTLQNALFVRDLGINPRARILLVTHRYHAIRARQSFIWAGFKTVNVHSPDASDPVLFSKPVLMEVVKWPVNIARAAFASVMMARDVPRERWIGWLN